jgi:hypothetical protein
MATTDNGRLGSGYTYDSFTGTGAREKRPPDSHFFWWCSGAYQAILKECPSEHSKYAGLGGVLLATFALASLSAGYAIESIFENPFWAVAFALLWGLIIFNFDRFLVSTMRKYGVSRRKQLWMAMPRIALALLIGITIARPLELKIFEKEIDVQITANRHQKLLMNDSLLRAGDRATIDAATAERARLSTRQLAIQDTLHRLQQAYIGEADGTGGSGRRGIERLTRLKQDAYDNAILRSTPELQQLSRQIAYQDSLIRVTDAAREVRRRDYEAQVTADVGFLEKNKALSDLASHESSVFWADLLITLLIILIETGPIVSKLIMNTGPYDLALANLELKQMAAAEEDMRQDKELVMERQKAVRSRKKERTDELLGQLSALQKRHIQEELDQWERGEDSIPRRQPLGEITRRILQRYGYDPDDLL